MTGLEELLAKATPGPWVVQKEPPWVAGRTTYDDARLIALAPTMARLLIDMGEYVRHMEKHWGGQIAGSRELLARLDTLAEATP